VLGLPLVEVFAERLVALLARGVLDGSRVLLRAELGLSGVGEPIVRRLTRPVGCRADLLPELGSKGDAHPDLHPSIVCQDVLLAKGLSRCLISRHIRTVAPSTDIPTCQI
jgi:hypothetical protein